MAAAAGDARGCTSDDRGGDDLEAAVRVSLVSAEEAGLEESDGVAFRDLAPADLPALRELQTALFPVRYNDSFYERLFSPGYFTLVGIDAAPPSDGSFEGTTVAGGGALVAVASVRITSDWRVAYIMTLGVDHRYRRRGLGARALRLCLRATCERSRCQLAQLHVKSLNEAAVAFYNSMGFQADEAEGHAGLCRAHYLIEGEPYDAFALKYDLRPLRRDLGEEEGGPYSHYGSSLYSWAQSTCEGGCAIL
mmetsp:Transcript_32958/g.108873  ORF Transcript_32958/g.108873 Transcript_32958/m.108873 type:complete len:250 (-) Transcript_32958:71-820(-)